MKQLLILLALILVLTACTPASLISTSTAIPPTQSPTQTFTVAPSITPVPTKVPMPEGWTAITETKEIGSWQVVINEKGEAATQIDGEWYPIDARGCYYKEFFDPKNQTDPKIDELTQIVNGGLPSSEIEVEHYGITHQGMALKGQFPSYFEYEMKSILYKQQLCYDSLEGMWKIVLDYVVPYDGEIMPEETKVIRSTVGWFVYDSFESFTYLEQRGNNKKATTVKETFKQWQELLDSQKLVITMVPFKVLTNNLGHQTNDEYEEAVRCLVVEVPSRNPDQWQDDINDPKFIEWALSEKSQLKYFNNTNNRKDSFNGYMKKMWRRWGELVIEGKISDLVVRGVRVQEQ